ncbi:DUF5518 domain-containing protein [Salinirubrum litoreum]|uniref:DUF5518 domain-containing protein n=1 Tax=Salinirubrum litoreum TaxID=1126234 RepID=A0ABD5R7U4_9EURY|nr:DUF5518 domain-containing protein [Salinirubrum litoreum]
MLLLRHLVADLTGDDYRPAVFLGLASIPATVAVNWLLASGTLPETSEVLPLVFACLVAGSVFRSRSAPSSRAGAITGLVGGVPVAGWQSLFVYGDWSAHPVVTDAVGESVGAVAVGVGVSLFTASGLLVVFWLVGSVAGRVGNWLAGRVGSTPGSGESAEN